MVVLEEFKDAVPLIPDKWLELAFSCQPPTVILGFLSLGAGGSSDEELVLLYWLPRPCGLKGFQHWFKLRSWSGEIAGHYPPQP